MSTSTRRLVRHRYARARHSVAAVLEQSGPLPKHAVSVTLSQADKRRSAALRIRKSVLSAPQVPALTDHHAGIMPASVDCPQIHAFAHAQRQPQLCVIVAASSLQASRLGRSSTYEGASPSRLFRASDSEHRVQSIAFRPTAPRSRHRVHSIAFTASRSRHRVHGTAFTASRSRHRVHSIALTASRSQHRVHSIAFTASRSY